MITTCIVCGREGDPGKKYCSHCGGALSEGGKGKSKIIKKVHSYKRGGGFVGFIFRWLYKLIFFSPLIVIVLCVIPPNVLNHDQEMKIDNPEVTLKRLVIYSRMVPVSLSQELINSYIKGVTHATWVPYYDWFSAPDWRGCRVELTQARATYFLDLKWASIPIYLSETFSLAGVPRQWTLSPESGAIGLMPLPRSWLHYLTPVFKAYAPKVDDELKIMSAANNLELLSGKVVFSNL